MLNHRIRCARPPYSALRGWGFAPIDRAALVFAANLRLSIETDRRNAAIDSYQTTGPRGLDCAVTFHSHSHPTLHANLAKEAPQKVKRI
jgi:hypothetical protein